MSPDALCSLSRKPLLNSPFFYFPCRHAFRRDALLEHHLKFSLDRKLLQRLVEELHSAEKSRAKAEAALRKAGGRRDESSFYQDTRAEPRNPEEAAVLKAIKAVQAKERAIGEVLEEECPLCGSIMIRLTSEPLCDLEGGRDAQWEI